VRRPYADDKRDVGASREAHDAPCTHFLAPRACRVHAHRAEVKRAQEKRAACANLRLHAQREDVPNEEDSQAQIERAVGSHENRDVDAVAHGTGDREPRVVRRERAAERRRAGIFLNKDGGRLGGDPGRRSAAEGREPSEANQEERDHPPHAHRIPCPVAEERVVAFSRGGRHNRSMLGRQTRDTIERFGMIPRGARVVAAVSGGLDSVVLLRILYGLADELGFSIVVAHLDHALRADSAGDAAFVRELAAELGLAVAIERIDVGALAESKRMGIEEAAREARHAFLDDTARHLGAERIALGHTADDQAETILFRLARGTGLEGLRGMDAVSGRIVRPLLYTSRASVRSYAESHGLRWREDATNLDLRFSRNRIRQRVLPELRAINPEAVEALQRAGNLADEALDGVAYLVAGLWPKLEPVEEPGRVELSRAALAALPDSVQAFVLREALRRVRGTLRGLERPHVLAARQLVAESAPTRALDLPQARVDVLADRLVIRSHAPVAEPTQAWSVALPLGHTVLREQRLTVDVSVESLTRRGEVPEADEWTELADADRISFPLVLRTRMEGDRFSPLGMGRDVRLKDFLINQRIPRTERGVLPLLCDQEKVVWVVGIRLSERAKIDRSTTRVLRMRVVRSEP